MNFVPLSAFDPGPDVGTSSIRNRPELAVTGDVLVKAFAFGPGASIESHAHPDSTNVLIRHARDSDGCAGWERRDYLGAGGRPERTREGPRSGNDGDEVAVITTSLCLLSK